MASLIINYLYNNGNNYFTTFTKIREEAHNKLGDLTVDY